jgi:hypothetical protein
MLESEYNGLESEVLALGLHAGIVKNDSSKATGSETEAYSLIVR